ncbi:RNB domain-containing ribonuclease [Kribbella sandramycini]|uniref:Exoribonuclease R n=1 Tax=Kribbella sandramycini TaxID=60450 RepID=A0A7Y4KUX6_9ACTN|nr:RNB domain-containing ribonuclease [Kribbella sandramycini]MBB6568280.1 exoribonuclease R [Kribbella sandramycini]NOL39127.1 RNB domain-containing ribonuclease [Kribbella sandramycini]
MPLQKVRFAADVPDVFRKSLQDIRRELEVPAGFPPAVVAAAEAAAPRLPELDRTDLEFVTIDPPDSMDLDQALHLERAGDGYVVHYAIADVGAFVAAGDPIDAEARRRGVTLYAPDQRTPLHPPELSEGKASLLPDQVCPAVLWTIPLNARGERTGVTCERALVKSRAKLNYAGVQQELDAGTASEPLQLLREIGKLREQLELERGGVNLPIPDQEIVKTDGSWSLEFRAPLPVEGWNAQISLLTGMAAADLMMQGKIGILRTLPEARDDLRRKLEHTAKALGIAWARETTYAEFIHGLDPKVPAHAAMLAACTVLFRGAGYTPFTDSVPKRPQHAAMKAEYAHVTAPLRRLVDRWGSEICLALSAGVEVPAWVRESLDELPKIMEEADRRANAYERAIVGMVEAGLLHERIGEEFDGVITDIDDREPNRGTVVLSTFAVEGRVTGSNLPLGTAVRVKLTEADLTKRTVAFELVP